LRLSVFSINILICHKRVKLIKGLPIINKNGYLICLRNNCNRRGAIAKRVHKNQVQIPNKKNIKTIVEALDFNAKVFYRLYEFLTYLPFDKKLEHKFNIDKYVRFVPFSPHSTEETKVFENKFINILSQKFEKQNKKLSTISENNKVVPKIEYNDNYLHKIKRELNKKGKRVAHGSSISCLYYSISFAALRDLYEEMEHYMYPEPYSLESKIEMDEFNKTISKCLLFINLFSEYLVDNGYHIPVTEIWKLMIDSTNFGYNAASTKNSYTCQICTKCIENGRVSPFEKENVLFVIILKTKYQK
jgi:hypothetical protein